MNRREFTKKALSVILTTTEIVFLGSCGGYSGPKEPEIPPVPPSVPPPIPQPETIKAQVNLIALEQNISRIAEIEPGKSVLDAIQEAFGYYRATSIDDLSGETIINGIFGCWRYAANGVEPSMHAQDFQLIADSQVDLTLM